MGRTGTLHAIDQEGVAPDLMTIEKGLGGGYQPIGAVLVSDAIRDALAAGSGFFQHGHTYIGHPMACAAALAVHQVIARDRLLDAVKRQGAGLHGRLAHAFGEHPHVGDIRGRGLFIGLELVANRVGKTPFEGNTTQKLIQHQLRVAPPLRELNPDVPEELAAVVARMLRPKAREKNPAIHSHASAPVKKSSWKSR